MFNFNIGYDNDRKQYIFNFNLGYKKAKNHSIRFQAYDEFSPYIKDFHTNDGNGCSYRAIAAALNINTFDEAYSLVREECRLQRYDDVSKSVIESILKNNGYITLYDYNPKDKDGDILTFLDAVEEYNLDENNGSYVILIPGHVFTMINGVIYEEASTPESDPLGESIRFLVGRLLEPSINVEAIYYLKLY